MSSLLFQRDGFAVAECAGCNAHLFSREAGTRRDRCVARTRATVSASASEIYASLRARLDIRHVQTCPTSVEQPPRGPRVDELPRCAGLVAEVRLHFDRGLTRIWRRPYHTLGKIPRDAAERKPDDSEQRDLHAGCPAAPLATAPHVAAVSR